MKNVLRNATYSQISPPARGGAVLEQGRLQYRFLVRVAYGFGMVAGLIGAIVFAGWMFLSPAVLQEWMGNVYMKTNTALGLLLAGASLTLMIPAKVGRARRWVGQVCATVVLLLGVLAFSEHLIGWNLGIDQLLASEPPGAVGMMSPNRPGPPASLSFLLLGTALLLLSRRSKRAQRAAVRQFLVLVVILMALLATIGYLFGANELYGIARYTAIAWPTAVAFLALGLGILCARPQDGLMAGVTAHDLGGKIIRVLVLPIILLPLILGWLRLVGERHGLYDAALGTAMMMLIFIVIFSALGYYVGRTVGQSARIIEQQRQFLAVTLASIGDAVIVTDREGQVTFLNGEAERLTGWSISEAVGQPLDVVFNIINEQTRQPAEDPVEKVLRLGTVVGLANHTILVAKDGQETPIDDSGAPIRQDDGTVQGVVLVFRDFSEQKQAEEALRLSEEKFALAFANNPAAIAMTSLEDGRLLEVNDTWLALNGYSRDEVVGLSARQLPIWPRAEAAIRFTQELRERGFLHGWEQEFLKKSGEVFIAQLSANVLTVRGKKVILSTLVDLTDRKRAETKLRDAHRLFKDIIDSTPSAIFLKDCEGKFITINAPLEKMLGMTREELRGKTDYDIATKEMADYWRSHDLKVMNTGQPMQMEEIADLKDGHHVFLANKFPLVDASGQVYGVCSISHDITDRKRAEEALRESEDRFHSIAENMSEGLMLFDLQGNLIYQNPASLRIHGFSVQEDWRIAHEDLPATWQAWDDQGRPITFDEWPVSRVFRGERFQNQILHVLRPVTALEFDASYNGCPIYDDAGRLTLAFITIREITEQRKAEMALRGNEKQLAADLEAMTRLQKLGTLFLREGSLASVLTEIVDAAIVISEADFGNIQLLDPGSSRLRIAAHRGFPNWWIDFWNNAPEGQGACGTALERGERVIVEDVQQSPIFVGTDALEIQIKAGVRAVQSTPLVSRSGRFLGMFSTHCKTPRRPDDRALRLLDLLARQTADIIEQAQAEEELRQAKAAAEAANEAKGRFLANMSHELRTPMNAILGMIDVALPRATDPIVQDCLQTAKGSADLLLAILNDLLDSAKIESGKLELESSPFSLRRMLDQITRVLAVRASEKGLCFYCRMPDETPDAVIGDRMRLQQILLNLAGNAIKFTERGEVEISLHALSQHGEVCLEFAVRDTGIGIPPSSLEYLFQPFAQVDATMARRFGGTGLGLSICKSLVEMMGGRIWVESQAGKGSTFYFTVRLPLAKELPSDFETPFAALTAVRAQLCILLVEDNPANQKLATYILQDRGHLVEIAGDGREAVYLAERNQYDVILMDVQMPGMNGIEATAAIRKHENGGSRVPIIAMTAHAMREDRERCLAAGMDGYLSKPVNALEMIGLVESLAYGADLVPQIAAAIASPAEISAQSTAVVFSPNDALARCFNSQDMLREMIQCFFDDVENLFPQMREALAKGDLVEVGRLGHRMKGTVVYLGAESAKQAALRTERFCKSSGGTPSEAEEVINALEHECVVLKALLSEHPLAAEKQDNSH